MIPKLGPCWVVESLDSRLKSRTLSQETIVMSSRQRNGISITTHEIKHPAVGRLLTHTFHKK